MAGAIVFAAVIALSIYLRNMVKGVHEETHKQAMLDIEHKTPLVRRSVDGQSAKSPLVNPRANVDAGQPSAAVGGQAGGNSV